MKRFFRVVWQINAILICLAGLLLVATLAFGLFSMLDSALSDRQPGLVAGNPGASDKKELAELTIDKVESLEGTTIERCSVQSGYSEREKFSSLRSSSGPNVTCNFIFYDLATNQQTVLFSTNKNVVVESDDFYFPTDPSDKRVVKWTSYVVADKDTNNDGFISSDDVKSLAVAQADGKNYHVYLTGLDRVLQTGLVGENDFFVFYEQDKSVFVARIDLANQKIILTQKVF